MITDFRFDITVEDLNCFLLIYLFLDTYSGRADVLRIQCGYNFVVNSEESIDEFIDGFILSLHARVVLHL